MSATRVVPAAVPSETQTSAPCAPSLARNTTFEPSAARLVTPASEIPGLMSLTMCVPAAVPSETHSSAPFTLFEAVKKSWFPATTPSESVHFGRGMTETVPAVVPSEM